MRDGIPRTGEIFISGGYYRALSRRAPPFRFVMIGRNIISRQQRGCYYSDGAAPPRQLSLLIIDPFITACLIQSRISMCILFSIVFRRCLFLCARAHMLTVL